MEQSATKAGPLFIKGGLPSDSVEHTFGLHQTLHFLGLQTVHLHKISHFFAPQIGDFVENKQRWLLPLHGLFLVSDHKCFYDDHK